MIILRGPSARWRRVDLGRAHVGEMLSLGLEAHVCDSDVWPIVQMCEALHISLAGC